MQCYNFQKEIGILKLILIRQKGVFVLYLSKSSCVVKLAEHNVRSDFDTVDFVTLKTELMHVLLLLQV